MSETLIVNAASRSITTIDHPIDVDLETDESIYRSVPDWLEIRAPEDCTIWISRIAGAAHVQRYHPVTGEPIGGQTPPHAGRRRYNGGRLRITAPPLTTKIEVE